MHDDNIHYVHDVLYYSYKVDRPHSNEDAWCSSENGAYRQGKYNKWIKFLKGENDMTKKEKEVFRKYKDMVTDDLFESMESGNEQSILIARTKFSLLQKLDKSLKEIEQGA